MKRALFFILCAALACVWAVRHQAMQLRECKARACPAGKVPKMLSSGRYTVECICVEVPK
jgi:hypothetical protein